MKQIVVFILAAIGLISNADVATSASALESLLPAETVLLIAAPEYASAKKHFKASALGKFWDSAEFRLFRKKFVDGFEANVLVRIEEELAVDPVLQLVRVRAEGRKRRLKLKRPRSLTERRPSRRRKRRCIRRY